MIYIICRIHICKSTYSLIYILQINTHSTFAVICGSKMGSKMGRVVKILNYPMCTFPAEVKQGDTLLSHLISQMVKQVSFFIVYLVPHFSHFCAFCWWFYCLKWPPNAVLKCCLVFQGAEGYQVPYGENICIKAWLWQEYTVLLAVSSMLMNQLHIK